jgi:formylglycine-generating enzyme required for sulfatase activity
MPTRRHLPWILSLGLFASACIPDVVPNEASLPGCYGVDPSCGASRDQSCCSAQPVPGGAFMLTDDQMSGTSMAKVSDFTLDVFEVTVGRFRQFVADYPHSAPAPGDGANPRIMGSGWDPAWDFGQLPADKAGLIADLKCGEPSFQTWTDTPGPNENLPMNCVSWQMAFAFCAWDGGRLPTDAEWSYAASGGAAARPYPWGDQSPDPTLAVYCTTYSTATMQCPSPTAGDILPVGSKPDGNGAFGHSDLAGSMAEWTLDWFNAFPTTCLDCANLSDPEQRNLRSTWGGDWVHGDTFLHAYSRIARPADMNGTAENFIGFRCARGG